MPCRNRAGFRLETIVMAPAGLRRCFARRQNKPTSPLLHGQRVSRRASTPCCVLRPPAPARKLPSLSLSRSPLSRVVCGVAQ
jgi:hypothetical protein